MALCRSPRGIKDLRWRALRERHNPQASLRKGEESTATALFATSRQALTTCDLALGRGPWTHRVSARPQQHAIVPNWVCALVSTRLGWPSYAPGMAGAARRGVQVNPHGD